MPRSSSMWCGLPIVITKPKQRRPTRPRRLTSSRRGEVMNYGPLIFLAAFFALASSWFGLVLTPQLQVGQLQQTNTVPEGATYPLARSGLARQGLDVYRANGCASCHTEQVRQTGTVCDIVLAEAGTNQTKMVAALRDVRPDLSETDATQLLAGLPKPVLEGTT